MEKLMENHTSSCFLVLNFKLIPVWYLNNKSLDLGARAKVEPKGFCNCFISRCFLVKFVTIIEENQDAKYDIKCSRSI